MRAIGYARVSTDKQADSGLGLEAQRAQLAAYAELYGFELVRIEEDAGQSASTLERPALSAALSSLRAGEAGALIVAKLDRLTRSVRDLDALLHEHFGERGADLISVAEKVDTTSAGGRLVLNVLMSVSQWEREAIGERTAAAMSVKRERLEYTGGKVRYGYRVGADGASLEEHPGEQAVIEAVRELRAGGLSLRAVSAELESRALLNRRGRPFAASSIRVIERGAA